MSHSKKAIHVGLTAVLALGLSVSTAQAADTKAVEMEKCFGIAKAGKNECATSAANSCANKSKANNDPLAWVMVPKGTCDKIVGGSLQAKTASLDIKNQVFAYIPGLVLASADPALDAQLIAANETDKTTAEKKPAAENEKAAEKPAKKHHKKTHHAKKSHHEVKAHEAKKEETKKEDAKAPEKTSSLDTHSFTLAANDATPATTETKKEERHDAIKNKEHEIKKHHEMEKEHRKEMKKEHHEMKKEHHEIKKEEAKKEEMKKEDAKAPEKTSSLDVSSITLAANDATDTKAAQMDKKDEQTRDMMRKNHEAKKEHHEVKKEHHGKPHHTVKKEEKQAAPANNPNAQKQEAEMKAGDPTTKN